MTSDYQGVNMADLQREKHVLRKLVKARDAIKRKYQLLKYNKINSENAFTQTFKPLIEPLEKLASKRTFETSIKTEPTLNIKTEPVPKKRRLKSHLPLSRSTPSKENKNYIKSDHDEDTDASDSNVSSHDEYYSDIDTIVDANETVQELKVDDEGLKKLDVYLSKLEENDKNFLDLVYRVRLENGQYKIGSSSITFDDNYIQVDNVKYPKTNGLMELLI